MLENCSRCLKVLESQVLTFSSPKNDHCYFYIISLVSPAKVGLSEMVWYFIRCLYNKSNLEVQRYYIHTEKYSPKSYVVSFRTQISSSNQRSE